MLELDFIYGRATLPPAPRYRVADIEQVREQAGSDRRTMLVRELQTGWACIGVLASTVVGVTLPDALFLCCLVLVLSLVVLFGPRYGTATEFHARVQRLDMLAACMAMGIPITEQEIIDAWEL
jgi:hypothetical protein